MKLWVMPVKVAGLPTTDHELPLNDSNFMVLQSLRPFRFTVAVTFTTLFKQVVAGMGVIETVGAVKNSIAVELGET